MPDRVAMGRMTKALMADILPSEPTSAFDVEPVQSA
jgi:hypothetical protein